MQHKRGKVAAHEGGGQQVPDTSRPTHARHQPPDTMRPTHAPAHEGGGGQAAHEGGGGQAARPAGRWPSRKSPYLTAPI